ERPCHRHRWVGKDCHERDWARLELLLEFRCAHLLHVFGARKDVVAWWDCERPERVADLILIRHGGIVVLMPERSHVDDGTDDEDEDCGEKDGEPERSECRHDDLLSTAF